MSASPQRALQKFRIRRRNSMADEPIWSFEVLLVVRPFMAQSAG